MVILIGVIIVQVLSTIALVPVKLGINVHFSLLNQKSTVVLKLFAIEILRVIVSIKEDKFEIYIKGKRVNIDKKENRMPNILRILEIVREKKYFHFLQFFLIVGTGDIMNDCLIAGALNIMLPQMFSVNKKDNKKYNKASPVKVLTSDDSNRLDFEIKTKLTMNVIQVINLIKVAK